MRKIWIYGKNHDDAQITLDLSDSGPVFGALDDMMMKMMEDDEKVREGSSNHNFDPPTPSPSFFAATAKK